MNAKLGRAWTPPQRPDPILTAPRITPTAAELPAVVLDLELSDPLPSVPGVHPDGRRVRQSWVLVRLFTEPLGTVLIDVPDTGLRPADLGAAVETGLGPVLRPRVGELPLPIDGYTPATEPAFLARRREVLATAPPITVVVCTRERPGALARCLDSLLVQNYPAYRILVVDNAPAGGATAEVVRSAARRGPVDYLMEPVRGLSCARNAAVRATPGRALAWIDDDEVADPHWLAEIARALDDHPDADVISGVTLPAELETRAQLWFEQFGGHSKNRGFTTAVFGPRSGSEQSPLYPVPPFAIGANMAFRPGVIERIGMFDTALGAGTPAMGCEDTLAFTQVLIGGGTIVYQPTALTHHFHRRDLDGLKQQMVGHATGLAAAYTGLLLSRPRLIWPLLRLAPTALRELNTIYTPPSQTLRDDFPSHLRRANRRGMLAGPAAYLKGRFRARRATR
ncbi:glycosyltransferase family 2 protein [Actinoplanes sp. NPDC026619]|uniref:glycosyltransferase n=1 Tax=Actinoplanes sp. NPDC026619 TaxID=3155798 RepID=UPI003409DD7A